MSRNLASTSCKICKSDQSAISLEEAPRPINEADTGPHLFRLYYEGCLNVAAARCTACGAKYLAWVSVEPGSAKDAGHWRRDPREARRFVDLSFRSTFDDEPGPDDLPSSEILRQIHVRQHFDEAQRLFDEAAVKIIEAGVHMKHAKEGTSRWETYRR